jgi:hypothetical protein
MSVLHTGDSHGTIKAMDKHLAGHLIAEFTGDLP